MSNLRNRITSLRRSVDAATRSGKAYGRLLDAINAAKPTDDAIDREVWQQEVDRLEALMDEMQRSVEADEHEIAFLERKAASVG